jgi:hypothetical protein
MRLITQFSFALHQLLIFAFLTEFLLPALFLLDIHAVALNCQVRF